MHKYKITNFPYSFLKFLSSILSIDFKFVAAALQPLGEAIYAQDNIPPDKRPDKAPEGAGRLQARCWRLRSTSMCTKQGTDHLDKIHKRPFSAAEDEKVSGDSERNFLKNPAFYRFFFKCVGFWVVLRVKKPFFRINSIGGFRTDYRVFRNGEFGGFGTEVFKLSGLSERTIGEFGTNYRDFRNAYSIFI